MWLRVLLDEHLKSEIAHGLTGLLLAEVSSVRDYGLSGLKDWQLMPWCIMHGWAICTRNADDFEEEHEKAQARGEPHPGILVVGKQWSHQAIYWALRQYLEALQSDPSLDPHNRVVKLPPASEEFLQRYADETPPV